MNKIDKTILQMKLAVITDFVNWSKILSPKIPIMVEVIKERFPNYKIDLSVARDTKERSSPGCRFVLSRKSYEGGNHIKVWNEKWEKILDHNPQETYRRNVEVAEKILKWMNWDMFKSPEMKEFSKINSINDTKLCKSKQEEFVKKYKEILSSK